jgi:hypothetical protein
MIGNRIVLFAIVVLAVLMIGCQSNSGQADMFSKKDSTGINKAAAVMPTNAVMPDTPVRSSLDDPAAMSNNKYNHFDTILMRDLTNQLWGFDGGIDGSKNISAADMAGFWLQFFPNGKYEKGTYKKITSKGKFTVDNQGFIEMIPSDSEEKKSEWQSKFNNDMLLLIGTPKYRDNTIQMRLGRIPSKPVAPAK